METTTQSPRILYTAKTHTSGGREHGVSRSSDGNLDIKLSPPGSGESGTNPEQLFAAGWSACFEAAMELVARQRRITLPADTAIDAEVDLGLDEKGAFLQARLNISIPGLDRATALRVIEDAHQTCPYSRAIRGNVNVEINLA